MNAVRKTPYRGINRWITMTSQMLGGYDDHRYLTFLQAKELGGSVRKGEKGTPIVFYRQRPVRERRGGNGAGDGFPKRSRSRRNGDPHTNLTAPKVRGENPSRLFPQQAIPVHMPVSTQAAKDV